MCADKRRKVRQRVVLVAAMMVAMEWVGFIHLSLGGFVPSIPSSLPFPPVLQSDLFVGLVVQASASGAEGPGFESRLRRAFSGSSHTSDLKIGTPVATLPGAWHYRVSVGTGWPGVSIL